MSSIVGGPICCRCNGLGGDEAPAHAGSPAHLMWEPCGRCNGSGRVFEGPKFNAWHEIKALVRSVLEGR